MTENWRKRQRKNYCKQILEDGFFHADPHPGNLWISKGQIAWLDLGMAGHLSSNTKLLLRKAITALLENDIYSLKKRITRVCRTSGACQPCPPVHGY